MSVISITSLAARVLVPPLSFAFHKGQHGCVAVVGGSLEYCGAPFYAALSALKTGADLAHVFCTEDAAVPIKAFSPELIVHPVLPSGHALTDGHRRDAVMRSARDYFGTWLPRMSSVVVGPGLGREPHVLSTATVAIEVAMALSKPIILDGDGLFLLCQNPAVIKGYHKAILTPNPAESKRLWSAALLLKRSGTDSHSHSSGSSSSHHTSKGRHHGVSTDGAASSASLTTSANDAGYASDSDMPKTPAHTSPRSPVMPETQPDDPKLAAAWLSKAFGGVTVVLKGAADVVVSSRKGHDNAVGETEEAGSPRRCGGQGDAVAGAIGVFAGWANAHKAPDGSELPLTPDRLAAACIGGCSLVRRAAQLAFAEHKRATTTPDIIAQIGKAFNQLYDS